MCVYLIFSSRNDQIKPTVIESGERSLEQKLKVLEPFYSDQEDFTTEKRRFLLFYGTKLRFHPMEEHVKD